MALEKTSKGLTAQFAALSTRVALLERLAIAGGLGGISPVADPAPDGGGFGGFGGSGGVFGGRIPIPYDPSPEELTKLSRVQLESRLADIVHARKRLDSLEVMFKEAIARG